MDYTLRQFGDYLSQADDRWRRDAKWQLMSMASAFAGGDGLKKLLRSLEK